MSGAAGVPPPERPAVAISVLGPLRVLRGGREVTPTAPKLRKTLALLAVSVGQVVTLETLAQELWRGAPDERACRSLQTYVSQLRKLLAAPARPGAAGPPVSILHTPQVGYGLRLSAGGVLDLSSLQQLLGRSEHSDPATTQALLRSALETYRGRVLADVPLGPALLARQARLDGTRINLLDRYLSLCLQRGTPAEALVFQEQIVAEDCRHEKLHAGLMRALAALGRSEDALEVFHRVRRERLARTGQEPGDILRNAHAELLRTPSGSVSPLLPVEPPAQVPVEDHQLIGNESRLAEAAAELVRPVGGVPGPIVVLGGPGAGKSAFSVRRAERVADRFPDGQLYTDLAAGTLADSLGDFLRTLYPTQSLPADLASRTRKFRSVLGRLRLLVVADNVNSPAAATALAPVEGHSRLILTTTSRHVAAPGTTVIELARLSPDEQIAVLSSRLGPHRLAGDPVAVRRLLQRCGGLPLALNAVVARAQLRPHWTVAQLTTWLTAKPELAFRCGELDLATSVVRSLSGMTRDALRLLPGLLTTVVPTPVTERQLGQCRPLRRPEIEDAGTSTAHHGGDEARIRPPQGVETDHGPGRRPLGQGPFHRISSRLPTGNSSIDRRPGGGRASDPARIEPDLSAA